MYLLSPSQQCALLLIPYALTPIPQRRLLPREMNKRLVKWLAERICPKRKSIPTPQPAYSLTVSYIWHFMNNFSLTISLLHFCFVSFYPQSNVKIFTLMLPDVNIEFRSVEKNWMGVNTMFMEFRTKSRSLSDRSYTFRFFEFHIRNTEIIVTGIPAWEEGPKNFIYIPVRFLTAQAIPL